MERENITKCLDIQNHLLAECRAVLYLLRCVWTCVVVHRGQRRHQCSVFVVFGVTDVQQEGDVFLDKSRFMGFDLHHVHGDFNIIDLISNGSQQTCRCLIYDVFFKKNLVGTCPFCGATYTPVLHF